MQDAEEFGKYLKRKGKKDHVVQGLVKRCYRFEEFLQRRQRSNMDMATSEDIHSFFDSMKDQKADSNNHLRAISLYYRFRSRPELSALASKLREQKIASSRKPCPLKSFKGVNSEHVDKLVAIGVKNAEQMLELGKTPASRQELSDKTGIPVGKILEFVKLSDLSRIEGVKDIRARLYYDAGIDIVEKMAKWNPEELRAYVTEFVKKTGFEGIAPLPKEAKHTVETAKKLPKIVKYQKNVNWDTDSG
jgi:replicative superfamily II helicase